MSAASGLPVRLTTPVSDAMRAGQPIVALESSVLAQGLLVPHNAEAASRMDAAVRAAGATPAITAVVHGTPTAGLTADELARFLGRTGVRKASARDLAPAMAAGVDAATTVAASLAICRVAGLPVFATGGIGGVHRGAPFDESADLLELSRSPVVVVCAGAKSILDIPATLERLETLGVTVVGYRCEEFPGFLVAGTGLPVPATASSVGEIVAMVRAQRRLGLPGAILVVQPPPAGSEMSREEIEDATSRALASAAEQGIHGAVVTPWLLAAVEQATGGRSLTTNVALLESNARLAGQLAAAMGQIAAS